MNAKKKIRENKKDLVKIGLENFSSVLSRENIE